MLNKSSRIISQLNESGSFPELVKIEPQLRVPASRSWIVILHSAKIWLFFKKIWVKKHNLNNYEFYMNLTIKTTSNTRLSIKGNFPIKTSEDLFVFHNVIYSRFIELLESFHPKTKQFFKGCNKNSKYGYWTYSR